MVSKDAMLASPIQPGLASPIQPGLASPIQPGSEESEE
jgi:hypothetical protein